MKNIFILAMTFIVQLMFSQIAIGKSSISNNSVSLEFGSENRGLLLPWVTDINTVTGAANGTMIYDISDHKIKVKYPSEWKDFTVDITGKTVDPISNIDGTVIQDSPLESTTAKVAIGTLTTTPGILVLEDNNKAMILPKVLSPHLNIINPSPGMIVYDTLNKQLAVFNGNVWSFWKP